MKLLNKSNKISFGILLLTAAFLLGCQTYTAEKTTSMPETINPTSAAETALMSAEVDIRNFAFDPATVTISAGGTVKWTNYDSAMHTATSDDVGIFDSGSFAKGESWSHTFDQAGTYTYHCTIHPYMEGTVIVK